jgi:two-component system, LytTR family, sensor histidine kinase AgrC
MHFGVYEWVYILTSIFGMYILYRFMSVFFNTRRTSARFEFLSYLVCTIIVNCIYLFINIPIVTMASNLAAFFLLSFNYESTVKKRLLSAILIYIILMIVEMIVVLMSGYFNFSLFSVNNYSSVFGVIFCNLLSYFVVLLLNNFKNIKKGEYIPSSYWLCIFLVPFGSLYTIIMLFKAQGLTVSQVLAALILIFLINIVSFHLYDVICRCLTGKDVKFIKSKYCVRQKVTRELQVKYEKGGLK